MACSFGSVSTVLALCNCADVDLFAADDTGRRGLDLIAARGCVDVLHALLRDASVEDKNTLLNSRNQFGGTCLHYAAKYGRLDMVSFLISNGADIGAVDNDGVTPLDKMTVLQRSCFTLMECELHTVGESPEDRDGCDSQNSMNESCGRDDASIVVGLEELSHLHASDGVNASKMSLMDSLMEDVSFFPSSPKGIYDARPRGDDASPDEDLRPVDSIRDVLRFSLHS